MILIILVSLIVLICASLSQRKKHSLILSPGPPRRLIIGNLMDLPKPNEPEWEHWLKHKKLYGPISSLRVLGQNIIILNDARLALQVLSKRSVIYSLRPKKTFATMSGWDEILGSLRNPEQVRRTRKLLLQAIGSTSSVSSFNRVQQEEVARFLQRVQTDPARLQEHIRKEAGAFILKIAYGYTVEPHGQDPLVDLADKAISDFSFAMLPATWTVDFIPPLKYLPSWFPGMTFIKTAREYRRRAKRFSDLPFAFVQQQLQHQCSIPSFLSNLLQEKPVQPGSEDERLIKWSAGSLYAGGADTTVSSIKSFFLAMAHFPTVQQKAQIEIDRVVGSDRLPQFEDRDELPYVNALVKEILRWHPVVPVNIAHVSSEDDICEGYTIPKGSSVLANLWAFTHDPELYKDPMAFNPQRFLPTTQNPFSEPDPRSFVFGFGRRACPGRTLADANIFLLVAQSLAVFNISSSVHDGHPPSTYPEFLPGLISHPAPFDLSICPRSDSHRKIIEELEEQYPWESSNLEMLQNLTV